MICDFSHVLGVLSVAHMRISHMYVNQPINQSIYLPIRPPIYLPIYLSIYLIYLP